jgi:branched-chain amino acid transport system substrate-binding protein
MRRLLKPFLPLVLLVALAAGACSKADGSTALSVGALYPTTGPQAPAGIEEQRGVKLAIERINSLGGVNGRKVRMVTSDSPTPESAATALRRLLKRKIEVVFGSHSSAVSSAVAAATRSQKVTFFETGAVGHINATDTAGKSFFRLSPMGANLGRAAVSFVSEELYPGRPLKWAVAHVDDVYGSAVAGGAVAEVKRRGEEVVGEFAYDGNHLDAAKVAADIAAAKPDALFVSSYLDDGIALRRAAVAAGTKLLAEIGTSSSYCHPAFGVALGADAVKLFASDKPDAADVRPDALKPEGRDALQWVIPRYQALYNEPMGAPALSGYSGALAVLGHLLPAAKGLAPDKVRAAAARVTLPTGSLPNGSGLALAPAGATDAGDNRNATSVIWEWVAPGQRAVVWPPSYATASILR